MPCDRKGGSPQNLSQTMPKVIMLSVVVQSRGESCLHRDRHRPRLKVRGGSEHQNWILLRTEAPARKEREVTATGADAGKGQPEQGALPWLL